MRIVKDYARLLLFVGGALIGVQVPSFVDQYGQRLEARLLESQKSLSEFQKDADKFFGGDLLKLVQHYKRNNDPVFNDGGESISALVSRKQLLSGAVATFNAQFYSPYLHTLATPVTEVRNETWRSYDYAIKLNSTGIAWALGVGLLVAMLVDTLLGFIGALFNFERAPRTKRRKPKARPTPPQL